MFPLENCVPNNYYIFSATKNISDALKNRLHSMGFVKNIKFKLIMNTENNIILKIFNSTYYIDKSLSCNIFVENYKM